MTNKKLLQYSSIATAACSGASAALTAFNPNLTIDSTTSVYIYDVAAGTFGTTSSANADLVFSVTGTEFTLEAGAGGGFVVGFGEGALLTTSNSVGAAGFDDFSASTYRYGGSVVPEAILGFQFDNGGTTHYGWVELTEGTFPGGLGSTPTANISRVVWEQTASTPAHVGSPIPEASTGLLCLAAGSILGFRRRRKTA